MIDFIGTPIFERTSTEEMGALFQDAMPTDKTKRKYYSISASDSNHLYEYESRDAFRDNNRAATHELPFPFTGTRHLVYNGSFYYHETNSQMLVRFNFNQATSYAKRIVDASYDDERYLYSSELGYMDVMADENGVWIVYSAKDTDNTIVRKLHPYILTTEYMWNLTLPHKSVGEMFIACGVLYAVESVTAPWTSIRFAFDLYQNKVLEANMRFLNPFGSNTMIAYNPNRGGIFTWDKGYQLFYPVLLSTRNPNQKEDSK